MRTATLYDPMAERVRIVRARSARRSRLTVAGSAPAHPRSARQSDVPLAAVVDVPTPFFGEGGPAAQPGTR
ncbi:MAG: hypothetical protein ACOH2F_00605 [Cellulomonas sp.]